ncbi:hypothetical protein ACN38_g12576 [Penicillium nordicum]|uniref:Uncharacterized protein n=1 Tax=Penicillium nordicum TaxID=229535 RepID=A0A0M8NX25_9EURO|nr:hypothetical protein ACN38_g12576 [Penicillium nordicum]
MICSMISPIMMPPLDHVIMIIHNNLDHMIIIVTIRSHDRSGMQKKNQNLGKSGGIIMGPIDHGADRGWGDSGAVFFTVVIP